MIERLRKPLILIALLLTSCASPPPLVHGPEAAGLPEASVQPPAPPPPTPPPAVTDDSVELADATATPWFEEMAALALAALRGRSLPDVGVAFGQHAMEGTVVELEEFVPDPLPPIRITGAIVPEVNISLEGATGFDGLEVTLAPTGDGVRLASVHPLDSPRSCSPLPSDHPLHLATQEVLEELREGRSAPIQLTIDECRGLLGEARDCERIPVVHDEDVAELLEGLRADLTTARGPTSYALDELIFIARGPSDEVYGLMLRFDCENNQLELRGEPLLRVMPPPR